ncbi:bifunctional riboflavin kinase/FAD synthetase [Hyphomicrobium sp. ghe19]|uniref:bifunctional riboflavin kinase/FAD synthetase n=1 Tax=Hyphomicrobium sp. ghe19 TaxID=2682968 RepID=UPI00136704E7|nr:Riboflavin biosynthesis protein RibF [Hyphomicrobium sp. ghe19]
MQIGILSSTLIGPGSSKPALELQDLVDLPERVRGGYVVIGNFDGVHLGHRHIVQRASNLAKMDSAKLIAITFDPHPRSFLEPHQTLLPLTDQDEKAYLLRKAGVDEVIVLNFDSSLSSQPAKDFVEGVLVKQFEARGIVASRNFRFGLNRAGDAAQLASIGPGLGLVVELIPPQVDYDTDEPISSTAVRAKLALGEVKSANRMLGRRWTFEGEIVHGDKRGRELGFPTANIATGFGSSLCFGIYAVRVLVDDIVADGVACYGTRPQFDDGAPRLEVHILNFSGDLYGKQMIVEFVAFLRPERTFVSVDALKDQIGRDCALAKSYIGSDVEASTFDTDFAHILTPR